MTRIGIFAATPWERHAVQDAFSVETIQRRAGYRRVVGRRGRQHVFLIQTGVGPARADAVCRAVLQEQPLDVAISSGLACALAPSAIGELVIGTEVVATPSAGMETPHTVACDPHFTAMAVRAAREAALPARAGRFVSVPCIMWRGEEKRRIAAETGAMALDMESAAIGAVAEEYHVPFVVIRAVSDLLDEDLPMDFNLFLKRADWLRGAWACLSRPAGLLGLRRMRTQMRLASQRLTMVFERLLDDVAGVQASEFRRQART